LECREGAQQVGRENANYIQELLGNGSKVWRQGRITNLELGANIVAFKRLSNEMIKQGIAQSL
jgi:glutamate dehydrogenase/leucine dehydrogenase